MIHLLTLTAGLLHPRDLDNLHLCRDKIKQLVNILTNHTAVAAVTSPASARVGLASFVGCRGQLLSQLYERAANSASQAPISIGATNELLLGGKYSIGTVACDQLLVRSDIDDAPLRHDHYPVRITDGPQAVSDNERGAADG